MTPDTRQELSNTGLLKEGVEMSAARLHRHGQETARLTGGLSATQMQGLWAARFVVNRTEVGQCPSG